MSRFAHIVSAHLIQYDGGLTEVPDLSFLESQYVIRQLQAPCRWDTIRTVLPAALSVAIAL